MSEKNLATQVGIENLKFQLSELAENTNQHVNSSLSKAHGINLISGYIDADGNNRTQYQDSNGDVVGQYMLRFTVENGVYYAPANPTSEPGQEGSGAIDTSTDEEVAADTSGGSALVTNYLSDQAANAQAINTDVLLPHTRIPHWQAHGSISVTPRNTYDADGHLVGDHVIQMVIDGQVREIPCCQRIGGPLQPPRTGNLPATKKSTINGDNEPVNVQIYPTPSPTGTLPLSYQYEYFKKNTGVWTAMTPGTSIHLTLAWWEPDDGPGGLNYTWVAGTTTLRIIFVSPGEDQTHEIRFRLKVTNPYGSVYSNECIYTCKST